MKLPTGAARGIDQLTNSASSAVFGIGAVLALDAEQLGGVSLQLIAMSVVLGLLRGSLYEAVLFTPAAERTGFASAMPRVGFTGALVTGSVMLLVGSYLDQPIETTIVAALVGLCTVGIDGLRYSAVIVARDDIALVADGVWLIGSVIGITVSIVSDAFSFERLGLVYAISALSGGSIAYVVLRPIIRDLPRTGLRALGPQMRFGADFALQVGPPQLMVAIAPLLIGLSGLGLFRAVATLWQPLATGMSAIRLAILGGSTTPEELTQGFRRLTAAAAVLSIVYLGGAIVFTQIIPVLDRGALSEVSLALICLFGFAEVARMSMLPLFDNARLGGEFRKVVRLRIIQSVALLATSIPLSLWLGTEGYFGARLIVQFIPVVAFGLGLTHLHRVTGGRAQPDVA